MAKIPARRRERSNELRRQIWPSVSDDEIWSRADSKGYTNIPRTMPLMLDVMDDLAQAPVAKTYLELWCRAFEEPIVPLSNAKELAFHSGFDGQRGERTWRERVKLLAETGFIKTAPGPAGELGYALLLNPYKVIKRYVEAGKHPWLSSRYTALLFRAREVGADDLNAAPEPTS